MMMRRSLCLLVFTIMSFISKAQLASTAYEQALKTKKAMLICMYSETPGYITSVEGKSPVGVLPEIMNAFVKHQKTTNNIDIALDYQPFKKNTSITEIFSAVTQSKDGVFGLVFIFMTEERKRTLHFSSPIFESPSFLLTKSNVPTINSKKEATEKWKDFTAYANQGNYYHDKFTELKATALPDLKIEFFKSYTPNNITETIVKDKAMVYVDISGLLYAMEKNVPFKNHKALQIATPSGIILSKNNSWQKPFNQFLESGFLKSPEFKKIIADNLGLPTLSFLKL
ncbi:MAG: ABC transporter substrate-binding protein [Chryseolinea sp.]